MPSIQTIVCKIENASHLRHPFLRFWCAHSRHSPIHSCSRYTFVLTLFDRAHASRRSHSDLWITWNQCVNVHLHRKRVRQFRDAFAAPKCIETISYIFKWGAGSLVVAGLEIFAVPINSLPAGWPVFEWNGMTLVRQPAANVLRCYVSTSTGTNDSNQTRFMLAMTSFMHYGSEWKWMDWSAN